MKGRTQAEVVQGGGAEGDIWVQEERGKRGWRVLRDKYLHDLRSTTNTFGAKISRRARWARHVARMVKWRVAYLVLVGKHEGKVPLRRPRRRWEDNIKMHIEEVGWEGVDWINLVQGKVRWLAVVNAVMKFWFPEFFFPASRGNVGFLIETVLYVVGWLVGWLVG